MTNELMVVAECPFCRNVIAGTDDVCKNGIIKFAKKYIKTHRVYWMNKKYFKSYLKECICLDETEKINNLLNQVF